MKKMISVLLVGTVACLGTIAEPASVQTLLEISKDAPIQLQRVGDNRGQIIKACNRIRNPRSRKACLSQIRTRYK